jgi:phosphatidyl-myo-inositol dimannoside synthase
MTNALAAGSSVPANPGLSPTGPCGATAARGQPGHTGRVLLLAPSRDLGGGIERCLATLEWAFAALGVRCQRVDLSRPGLPAHARLLAAARTALRASPGPARLVAGHRALLPAAWLLAGDPAVRGISVVCHGAEAWDARLRPRRVLERRLLRRPGVRVVAVSSFTAGALASGCQAAVLPPGLPPEWFGTLTRAAGTARTARAARVRVTETRLITVFRLADWRDKGLPELIRAVAALGRPDVRLRVCGSGDPPPGLVRLIREHPWCELRTGLTDTELAGELAAADLCVLATRTRAGRDGSGEGFGMVLLEAQVAGTPVLVPAYGGSHDAYLEGITGAAPVDESAGALAAALRQLLADPARLAWMGRRAAGWAREAFDPARYPDLVASRLL